MKILTRPAIRFCFLAAAWLLFTPAGYSEYSWISAKLLNQNTCNYGSIGTIRRSEKEVNSLVKLVNESQTKQELANVKRKLELAISDKKSLNCYEKINFTTLYATLLYKMEDFEGSVLLFDKAKDYKGLDSSYKKRLSRMSERATSKVKEAELQNNKPEIYSPLTSERGLNPGSSVPSQNSEFEDLQDQVNKLKKENEILAQQTALMNGYKTRIAKLENSLADSKGIVDDLKGDPSLIDLIELTEENEQLKEKLIEIEEEFEEYKKNLSIASDSDDLKTDIAELYVSIDAARQREQQANLAYQKIQNELKIKDDLLQKYIDASVSGTVVERTENNSGETFNPWWLLLIGGAFLIYFVARSEQNKNSLDSGNSVNLGHSQIDQDIEKLDAAIKEQIPQETNIEKAMDAFIYNYLIGLTLDFFGDDLKAKVALDELLDKLTSGNAEKVKSQYLFDESKQGQEGQELGKKDAKKLKGNATATALKAHLESNERTDT